MKTIIDSPISLGVTVASFQPGLLQATVICKLGLLLSTNCEGPAALEKAELSGDLKIASATGSECAYASDFANFKPAGEVLATGTAYAPRNQPTRLLSAGLRVGTMSKTIVAGVTANASPFTRVKLDYAHTLGGPGDTSNPVGRNRINNDVPIVAYPQTLAEVQGGLSRPASFAPISPDWEPRRSKAGSYQGDYLRSRWPWYPADFNFSYFNSAPEDQQVKGYFRGDEGLEFTNLHPLNPSFRSKLPGVRVRCFIGDGSSDGTRRFREVPMNLDTIWFDLDEKKGALLWRGVAEVLSLKLREVDSLFVLKESMLDKPRTVGEAQREWEERIQGPTQTAIPEPQTQHASTDASAVKEMEESVAAAADQVSAHMQQVRRQMIEHSIKPLDLNPPVENPSLTDVSNAIEERMATSNVQSPEFNGVLEEALEGIKRLEEEKKAAEAAGGSPRLTAEQVKARAAAKKILSGTNCDAMDLAGTDFSELDLTNCSFRKAILTGCCFRRAKVTSADFSEADAENADFGAADLDESQFSKTKLTGATFAGASVTRSVFSELDLSGVNFSACRGAATNFTKSKLNGATFVRAKLTQANFAEAELGGVSFFDAGLAAARFGKAKAAKIRMDRADLTGLHGAEADFSGGRFRNAKAAKAIFEKSNVDGADFSGADLSRATFSEASAKNARFVCCQMPKAVFDDAELESADFSNSNLLKSTFDRANLARANLRRANCFEAGFWETRFDGTSAEDANMKGTKLA